RPVWMRLAVVSVLAAASAAPALAQQLLSELKLPGEFGSIGDAVGGLGDVDGDGVPDLLVAGKVGTFVKSGADGSTLAFASNGNELPLATDASGDLDGDGTTDFLTATAATVRACSGADGALLWSAPAGTGSNFKGAVEAVGDIDGDGVPDVALSESQVPNFPQLRVFSGADGRVLYAETHTAFAMDAVEWDGTPGLELVVGDPDFSPAGTATGRVRVIEPLDGATLATFLGGQTGGKIGRSVASLGDVSGDGVPDVIASPSSTLGVTTVWSGADGSVLYPLPSTFFFHIERVGDVTGDGKADFVGGGPGGGVGGFGSGQLRNGATGALIQTLAILELTSFKSFKGPGDLNADGVPDLLVGSSGAGLQGVSSARALALPGGALLQHITNPAGGAGLGRAMDGLGDFDGDGQGDFVLGSTDGAVVFGLDGDVLAQVDAPSTSILLGVGSVAVAGPGDVDGDGVPDVALGNGLGGPNFHGVIALHSGATGAVLHSLVGEAPTTELGWAIADVPDRNGDGVRDLWVSAPAAEVEGVTSAGEVRLLSGTNLALLDSVHGDATSNHFFGWTLDADGDLDQDGVPDLAVGSRGGVAYVISGATGKELLRKTSPSPQDPAYPSFVGDADGDGVEDLLVREPLFPVAGRVRLYSGATGLALWEALGAHETSNLGETAAGAGDVNGDGFADVAISERSDDATLRSGTVWVRSGPDGRVLDEHALPPDGNTLVPGALLAAGLVDEGGCGDLLAGIPGLANNGGAQILASSAGGVHGFIDLGFAKPGTGGLSPELRGYGDLSAGGLVTIKLRHAKPSTTGAWFIGMTEGNLPFKQGVLVPSPLGFFLTVPLGTNGAGEVSITAPNPNSVFLGLSLYQQFWFVDPAATAGLSASNGMEEIFK
ncbi:MAG TPA: VCBS repeat-containing protein, partial [Planctomycetota bacterium]|nr:VCBS repeat-containing protein [Planctomycetota bacterium]